MKKYNDISVILFEDKEKIPTYIKCDNESSISLSNKYTKFGDKSLRWDLKNNGELSINKQMGYNPFDGSDCNQKRDSFVIWIYNEKPLNDKLKFEFGKEGKVDCYFDFGLEFEGWHCCWVMYDRDMTGNANSDMNVLKIKAPKNIDSKTIYINKIILSVPIDARHHSRDYQVPFVNIEADKKANSHWMSLYTFSEVEKRMKLNNEYADQDIKHLNIIEDRYKEFILQIKEISEDDILKVIKQYNSYEIKREKGVIKSKSVDFIRYFELFDVFNAKKYAELFNSISVNVFVK